MANSLINDPTATDYRLTGPIAGVMAQRDDDYYQGAQERSFRDSDLANAIQQHEYQQAMLDDPVKAMKRQLDMASGQDEMNAWNNGTNADLAQKVREQKIAAAVSGKSTEELKTIQAKANKFLAATNEMEPAETADSAAHARNKQLWDEKVYPELVANGMAKGIPKEYDPVVTPKVLKSRSEAAIMTSEMIQKTRQISQENQGKLDVANATGRWHYNATVDSARVMAGAAVKEGSQTTDQQAETQIEQLANSTGVITTAERDRMVQIQIDKYKTDNEFVKDKPTLRTAWAKTEGDKDARKRLADAAGIAPTAEEDEFANAMVEKRVMKKAQDEVARRTGNAKVVEGPSRVKINTPTSAIGGTVGQPVMRGQTATVGGQQYVLQPKGNGAAPAPQGMTPSSVPPPAGGPTQGDAGSPLKLAAMRLQQQIQEESRSPQPNVDKIKSLVAAYSQIQQQISGSQG